MSEGLKPGFLPSSNTWAEAQAYLRSNCHRFLNQFLRADSIAIEVFLPLR
jgi:hypothetical protein